MQPPSRSEPPAIPGRRSTSRLRVRLPAKIITTSETLPAVLDDLCYFGARFSCKEPPKPGSEVIVQWSHHEAFGAVAWAAPGSFGVNFFDPVGPKVLLETRDLDDAEHLPNEHEQTRRFARAWAAGGGD